MADPDKDLVWHADELEVHSYILMQHLAEAALLKHWGFAIGQDAPFLAASLGKACQGPLPQDAQRYRDKYAW